MRGVALLVMITLGMGTAVAQPVDPRNDPGWQLYHQAFDALLHGERRKAAELVAQLQREYPGHPAASLGVTAGLGAAPGVVDRPRESHEGPTSGARAELAIFQTLHGIALGIELCVLADCDSGEAFFGIGLLGGGAGALASLGAITEVTPGQRALLNSGTGWGAVNATLAVLATQPDSSVAALRRLVAAAAVRRPAVRSPRAPAASP